MKIEDFGKKVIYFGLGLAAVTKEKVEEIAADLVKRGELQSQEAGDFKEKLMEKIEKEKKELEELIKKQVKAVADDLGFVTKDEIKKLKTQISKLEKLLEEKKSS